MEKSDYKSILHYIALQPSHSGLSFEEFLLYFSNKDIGKLDLALSETILRAAFHQRSGSFYDNNKIICIEELIMISSRKLSLGECIAPDLSIGENSQSSTSLTFLVISIYYRRRGD